MKVLIRFLWVTLQHKWYVFLAGRDLGVYFHRLILHDWTKFIPYNAYHYARYIYGPKDNEGKFLYVWLKHQNTHDHHWEYWISRGKIVKSLPMSDQAIREMVADWFAAGKAYNNKWPNMKEWIWLQDHVDIIFQNLNPKTRRDLYYVLKHTCNLQDDIVLLKIEKYLRVGGVL